jgi:glycine hydroxymethyltransferase
MSLKSSDLKVARLIVAEENRQENVLELIPSENISSREVREALGSVFNDKYAEGKPHARYYGGNKIIDQIEDLAVERVLKLFKLTPAKWHANVQPYSGTSANIAVYFAFLKFGDKIMGMRLDQGGHISHGLPMSLVGQAYNFITYGVDPKTEMLDYGEIAKMARREKPKMIVCGYTAYSRIIDFKKFAAIAKSVGALLFADISHIAGLIVGGVHPSCFPYADVVTTTTHKTLRGPRGGVIITRKEFAEQVDRAVFPGVQGGPHEHQIAAKAVCFAEAMDPDFKIYAKQVVKNAKALAKTLQKLGLRIVSGGTDNHLMVVDLRSLKINGQEGQNILEEVGMVVNKNTIPNDPQKPFIGSGIRLGTPAITTRGMKEKEMIKIAELIYQALTKKEKAETIKKKVIKLCRQFPI